MSVVVEVASDGTQCPVGRERTAAVVKRVLRAEGVRNALVSIAFVSRSRIASMNRRHLRHAGDTDVISFAFTRATPRDPLVGDIYICPEVARRNAARQGIGVRLEIVRLIVHGTLHVLGYDHPDGEDRERSSMWRRQERLVRRVTRKVA